jgi:argonaute-like protein implicated in RNA metabolism and viral defense
VGEALGKDYYKEGKSIPSPLLLTRYAGHGPMLEDAGDVLALTKMNWNNDNLYDREPATLAYAGVLARTVRRMPDLLPRPYQLRFFM